jgi:hypothetical protein
MAGIGGKTKGSGRKKREPTTLRTFRVNEEALKTCLNAKVKVNFEVNKLVIRLAERNSRTRFKTVQHV